MAKVTLRKIDGGEAGELELNDAVFGIVPSEHCVQAAVHHHLAGQRSGTHSTKRRGEVRGGGRKPWRQKGTGRARQGSIRSPQWKGGGVVFGPKPRDYSYRLNRKIRRNAVRSVLSHLASQGQLVAIEEFGLAEPKTKALAGLLSALGLEGTALLLTENSERALYLSARNMAGVTCSPAASVNVYELLSHDHVVATKSALELLGEVFA